MRRGCFPGTFDPATRAHVAIAEAAIVQCHLDRIDLVVSRVALAKEHLDPASLDVRLAKLRAVVAEHPRMHVEVSDRQLLVDLAEGYDVLVMGADKWAQVLDPAFYGGSAEARDAAVSALPALAVAPRPGPGDGAVDLPAHATTLVIPPELAQVSSTAVRAGRTEWQARPARPS